ncbi:hypothetical protein CXG81DRAFT_29524 [Caulochytrium protostelioides]|uniref:GDP-mannose transporter n=1 Tax=Caulochytrium protostelioides TaxID=1555241 RepID=A0A4P9XAJ5_9FUNG|nr:hypothetical protein CXG81DRAFT_29524 [Caulochytrium protostelioides]|eukprot:RKP02378.1 hypothetical protein CXG81DRAFT_29524 [Caulochytrium protostelioides]
MGSRHVSSSLGAIVTYCGASMLMTLTNKAILSSYAFHVNFFLLLVQSVVTVAVLEIATALGYTSHRPFSLHDAKRWGIVSLGLIGMIYTGSKAIQYMSIPLFTVFKNLTIIMIAYGERTFFGGAPLTTVILLSFVLMVLSSVVAGWADLTSGHLVADSVSPLLSYGWMLANCLTSTIFALMMRVKIKQVNFKDYDTVFYNNLLPVPILAALTLVAERAEWRAFYATYWAAGAPRAADVPGLLVAILVSGVCGFAISFGSAWCVRVTSSTTYSMVGALNKLPIAVAGMVFFHAPVTLASVLSVLIAFAAGDVVRVGVVPQQRIVLPGLLGLRVGRVREAVDRAADQR